VAQRLISVNQSAFIKGRYILESVVVAHEIVHSLHKSGDPGLILKLDYEKAYDRVSWNFLFDMLTSRGFSDNWVWWMKAIVKGGSVGVNLNGEESPYFKPGKGLRQGDPISPLLFNLVGDVLTKMWRKASRTGHIKGLLSELREDGIVSLQYADDTIVFADPDPQNVKNLKCSLIWFEKLSGMRINFHKSEIIPCNLTEDLIHEAGHILGCPVGEFPIKYLGVPLHYDKLRREDIQPLVDKVLKRIASWRGKLLSHAARITLIQTCLASIPVYLLSFIKFPKWAIKTLNTHLANCLWSDTDGGDKYHLANWESICMAKDFGGLGVPNLRDLNICLMASWIKRYQEGGGKLWRELIDNKYPTSNPNIFCSSHNRSSQFFKGLMWAAKAAEMGYRWKVGNGKKIKFWEDNWLGHSSLAVQFWDLYLIVNEKSSSIADLWDGTNLKCTFRRTVDAKLGRLWMEIVQIASTINFSDEEDALIWKF
jgi:hypothetical protein